MSTFLELVVKRNSLPRTDEDYGLQYTKLELNIQSTHFIIFLWSFALEYL